MARRRLRSPAARPERDLYGSRPVSGRRRSTREELDVLRGAISDVVSAEAPITLRGLFYRLVGLAGLEKSERAYKKIVRVTGQMRRDGEISFADIVDGTRWMRKPHTHSSLAAMLEEQARLYRRSLWSESDVYVEVWCEKEAIAGVLYDVTSTWDVPLMVCRGYPSITFLHSAAEEIADQGRPTVLYYFGDLDPSGVDIARAVEDGIREFAPDAEFEFVRTAVTREQVEAMGLPTRPTKKTDSRARDFDGESVEVDAIPPDELRRIVGDCIARHVDAEQLAGIRRVEGAERDTLAALVANLQEREAG